MEKQDKELSLKQQQQCKARLPFTFFENCLFAATKAQDSSAPRSNLGIQITRTNKFGDTLTLTSSRSLLACPDMGVFLAVVALAQKNCELLIGEKSKTVADIYHASFSMSDLYNVTQTSRRSRDREKLLTSMDVLGSVNMALWFNDPEKHNGFSSYAFSNFWSYKISSEGKGRRSATIDLYPAKYIMPVTEDMKLYADAILCNSLRSDTARALFWALIRAEHLNLTVPQLQELCGTNRQRTRDWVNRQLMPAFEELGSHDYRISKLIEADGTLKWCLKRPTCKDNDKILDAGN